MTLKISIKKKVPLFLFIFCLAVISLFSEQETTNYYLGVLADGYPASMVIGEFRYADARVVNMHEKMILFGISEKTKLTTFLKNLPFLAEVYVDAADIAGNIPLMKDPLVQDFLSLQQQNKPQPLKEEGEIVQHEPAPAVAIAKQDKKSDIPNNMALIDQLIREKAKKLRAEKNTGKTGKKE